MSRPGRRVESFVTQFGKYDARKAKYVAWTLRLHCSTLRMQPTRAGFPCFFPAHNWSVLMCTPHPGSGLPASSRSDSAGRYES